MSETSTTPPEPLKQVLVPQDAQVIIVNHWDWPFAWIMSFAFIVAFGVLWWYGRKHK